MSNDIITTDLQSQEVDGLIELYELELSNGTILYFHPGLDENLENISYDGNTYIPLPIILDGIEALSDGAANRPTLTVANVTNLFRAALSTEGFDFEDLLGTKITRRQTLEKYLANAAFEFPRKVYILDRISAQNNVLVSFELTAPFDVSGVRLPNRVIVGKYCSWVYQGYDTAGNSGCTWAKSSTLNYNGTDYTIYFDIEDRPLIQSGVVTFSVWSAGTYALDAFVSYNGKTWRSETDTNTSTPGTSINWKEVITWSNWSAGSSYSVGSYVRHDDHIWKALLSSTGVTPVTGSLYWTRVDYCGKTLQSCKSRFQFSPTVEGVPSAYKETDRVLPFGAFPGSVKFK